MGQRFDPSAGIDADQVMPDAGRIEQRPEKIEDRPRREVDAHRHQLFQRGMMRRREHEADAGFGDAPFDIRGV